jgi:hypothetical protein
MRVVAHLRQQPAQADAVGRAQRHLRAAARVVGQRASPARWQSSKLPATRNARTLSPKQPSWCACRGETRPSGYRMTTLEARRRWKGRGDRRAGIAGGGDQDRQRRSSRGNAPGSGQEARAVILERRGRAVEQLQHEVARARSGAAAGSKSNASSHIAGPVRRSRIRRRTAPARVPQCRREVVAAAKSRAAQVGHAPARTGRHRARGRRRWPG